MLILVNIEGYIRERLTFRLQTETGVLLLLFGPTIRRGSQSSSLATPIVSYP